MHVISKGACGDGCRLWGIGTGQTAQQRQRFEAQLSKLQNVMDKYGGPYLVGDQVTLVSCATLMGAVKFILTSAFGWTTPVCAFAYLAPILITVVFHPTCMQSWVMGSSHGQYGLWRAPSTCPPQVELLMCT